MRITIAIFQKNLLYEKFEKTIIKIYHYKNFSKTMLLIIYNKKFHI